MKKQLFILFLLISSSSLFAKSPFERGVYSLSGSIQYYHTSSELTKGEQRSFSCRPQIDYFIINGLALGFGPQITYQYHGGFTWGGGFGASYYLNFKKLKPFIGLYTIQSEYFESTSLNIGFVNFLAKNVALETKLSNEKRINNVQDYQKQYTDKATYNSEHFYIGIGVKVFIF